MKVFTSVALLNLLSVVLGHDDHGSSLGPSPTESVGCVSHGDYWDCEGPKVTPSPVVITTTISDVAITTTLTASHDDDHDHDHDDDHHSSDTPGTGSLKPSPTESFGCVAHGDHWHCEGRVGAASTSATATGATSFSSTTGIAAGSSPTSGATRPQAAGLGIVGVVVGMVL